MAVSKLSCFLHVRFLCCFCVCCASKNRCCSRWAFVASFLFLPFCLVSFLLGGEWINVTDSSSMYSTCIFLHKEPCFLEKATVNRFMQIRGFNCTAFKGTIRSQPVAKMLKDEHANHQHRPVCPHKNVYYCMRC